jgi:hypothetical protein
MFGHLKSWFYCYKHSLIVLEIWTADLQDYKPARYQLGHDDSQLPKQSLGDLSVQQSTFIKII